MSTKRMLLTALAASAVLLALGIGSQMAGAQPPAQAPSGFTIPYPGHLTDATGQPVPDGTYDFTFTLYDTETGGAPLWAETQAGVAVQGGAFQALLDAEQPIPPTALDGGDRWLEVAVRGPGEAAFTALAPRQRLSAASTAPDSASAPPSCPHDHFGEQWSGTGSDGLLVTTNNWTALTGWSDYYIGVAGISTPYSLAWPSGHSYGVFGYSYDDHGVYGRTFGQWGWVSGVYGEASKDGANGITGWNTGGGVGVYGHSETGYAGYFAGPVHVVGDLSATGSKPAVVQTQDHGWRHLYSMESTGLWFEDFGSAQLADGQAVVTIEPIFAQTVNLTETYHVYLTPLGDCSLYVAEKTPTSFTVRAMGGQTCAIAFDYRIVAKRLGYEGVRMAPAAPPLSAEGGGSP